ncbi:MAG: GNAT family N-acetyltransferase [Treponema sp.]|nr:GNAT family N-acetyltransferase [Treponema sp.]
MKSLITERLILRKFSIDDFEAVHSYASNNEHVAFVPWGPNSEEETREYIDFAIEKSEESPISEYRFAVVCKETDSLIGDCEIIVKDDEATLAWHMHPNHCKKGYGTETALALIDFGFSVLGLRRIIAHCDSENISSYRVMEKAGMRREGLFLETRKINKLSDKEYSDELIYAILRDEWEIKKDLARYYSLPFVFDDFIDVPELNDGVIYLVCISKQSAIPEKKYVPSYTFAICKGGEKIGEINLRIGYKGGLNGENLYYGGQIGYGIDEKYRGNGYAVRACRLLGPVAKAHQMMKLYISNDVNNIASRRVCEKIGARFLRKARVPGWHDLYAGGTRFINIYEWSLE